MAEMSEKTPELGDALRVGARVLVRRPSETAATGAAVEDCADLVPAQDRGHEWAPVPRWAVALDDGRLVFADTEDLTVDPSPGAPEGEIGKAVEPK
ncbi:MULTISPECIES: hypothetical protein [unclassified Rhodococcus (in: high G+C Gram-positive bacteria)]|jgi:hypothetical protein|uniref:hypothetical protein n=1 Tax=unclassified Rhodococcus (in: high G+C Gram-positive bacteria) TaxID=192944 RepID=UPI00031FCC6F|nr:hypothetical protein [Rhodococcus sp. DK17]